MVGEIISEWWATSDRNGARDHSGMLGDIERNQHTWDKATPPSVEKVAGGVESRPREG